ncbi:hypothetical protein [Nocardia stercoris]|uniref:Uncharacterized protein n=1 Tax=Nocardia stercoris TaxID=2483361 RepID=A0A3M2KSR7_9NOCA|nr:hypothetical protein [Nocardia stercoris]RMI28131.1 hypothetical protein EBN03_31610 [Nocardia stercoris]
MGFSLFLTFKYDLGGQIRDAEALEGVLTRLHGPPTPDPALLRSWNLSYLAGHAPIIRHTLPGGEVDLGGIGWHYTRQLQLFPWLGIASIDYRLSPDEPVIDPLPAYDDIIDWKNRDYIPYLTEMGALGTSLAGHVAIEPGTELDLHTGIITELRAAVARFVEPRHFLYAFHDFRICWIVDRPNITDTTAQQLLWLSDSGDASEDAVAEFFRAGTVEVASSGWSTVIRALELDSDYDTASVLGLLNLVHTHWYACQMWINAHEVTDPQLRAGWRHPDRHILSASQLALAAAYLAETRNLNVMLKDPAMLRVAVNLEAHFEVSKHHETAQARLRALESYSRQLGDYRGEIELRRFQGLFAVSAAASVAALVPALAQVGFSSLHIVTTIVPLAGVWGLFAVDYSPLRKAVTRRYHGRSGPAD